ncbi:B-box zinc finger domain-containing protein [Babesia ovata]|uniref:B-box zinc finger domain-containing protein n=1 Tax=Babesia ovata TaxID=189622 RepID=A0A2H6KGV9_9APIC|nr:B-box zinc finger domain-containing protein [Babesia ovata]GBE62240.1 B-box zinc finger domain-containing protein [Babesia ovata]
MSGSMLGGLLGHGIDLGQLVKTDGTDLFSGYANVARDRLPKIADSVAGAFGRVLDIFDRPTNLRKPEFDTAAPKPSQQAELADAHRDLDVEIKEVSKPKINETLHVDYLTDMTREQFNATQDTKACSDGDKDAAPRIERKRPVTSASPCDAEARLCSSCYLSLATVRCDSCVMHFCAVCAVERHAEGIQQSHKLVTATSGKEARLNASDALSGKFSYGQMAAGASGSLAGNFSKDLSIDIRSGESAYPAYDSCAIHRGRPLRLACVQCHLLPVCDVCASEAHSDGKHKVVEIEYAVAEVKELLGECLGAVVRRHNDLSVVLPELQQLSDASSAGLKNATRSIRSGLERALDALKLKRSLGTQDIRNMQQVGSSALNRMMHASGVLNRYLRGCLSQLEAINRVQNPGMALNMYVELRSNFEKLLFTDEEIPDLVLEVPHWHLHCGNLPNLLSEYEARINMNLSQIASLTSTLRKYVRETVTSIEEASTGATTARPQQPPCPPRRQSERRTRTPGFVTLADGVQNTLDIVTHAELKALFLRRDSQRCSWRQRAVYLCGRRLFVLESDLFADDVPVESSVDLGAVTVRSFADDDAMDVTKLQRMGHPNGFEITERKGRSLRYWLFTCESEKTVQLWFSRLRQLSEYFKAERQSESSSITDVETVDPVPENVADVAASLQNLHLANFNAPTSGLAADPEGERKTCEQTHDPDYFYNDSNFKLVAESLRKIKEESRSLYDKCFKEDREAKKASWKVEPVSIHSAALPYSVSASVADGLSVDGGSSRDSQLAPESVSSDRYAMPDVPMRRHRSRAAQTNVFSGRDVQLHEAVPAFKYSPEVRSPRSIHKFFQELARRVRREDGCDTLDRD